VDGLYKKSNERAKKEILDVADRELMKGSSPEEKPLHEGRRECGRKCTRERKPSEEERTGNYIGEFPKAGLSYELETRGYIPRRRESTVKTTFLLKKGDDGLRRRNLSIKEGVPRVQERKTTEGEKRDLVLKERGGNVLICEERRCPRGSAEELSRGDRGRLLTKGSGNSIDLEKVPRNAKGRSGKASKNRGEGLGKEYKV